jgi:hypothetical protein
MTPAQPSPDGILRHALELSDERKARLLEEMLQHELGSSAENNRPFLEVLPNQRVLKGWKVWKINRSKRMDDCRKDIK